MNPGSFWPPVQPAQIDYERLRTGVLGGDRLCDDLAGVRFARRGLAGLIAWPVSDPVFIGELLGAVRPAWSPHTDPRIDALGAGYQFLLDLAAARPAGSITVAGGGL